MADIPDAERQAAVVSRSTFFFRIKRRSVPLPPDGRPPLLLHHPASNGQRVSSHYTECKSPYLYG